MVGHHLLTYALLSAFEWSFSRSHPKITFLFRLPPVSISPAYGNAALLGKGEEFLVYPRLGTAPDVSLTLGV